MIRDRFSESYLSSTQFQPPPPPSTPHTPSSLHLLLSPPVYMHVVLYHQENSAVTLKLFVFFLLFSFQSKLLPAELFE